MVVHRQNSAVAMMLLVMNLVFRGMAHSAHGWGRQTNGKGWLSGVQLSQPSRKSTSVDVAAEGKGIHKRTSSHATTATATMSITASADTTTHTCTGGWVVD